MAVKVASLLIDIAADIAKLKKDFDDAGKTVQGFGRRIEAMGKALAGIFAVRSVINFGEGIQKQLDDMADSAENLKLPFEDFQALTNAAYLAGQSVEGVSNAFAKFNQFMGKSEGGAKEQIELLQELGLTINNLDGTAKPMQQRLQEMATAITQIENPARRSAIEMEVFGKSGQRVSAILEQWKRPLADVNRELQEQGLVHAPDVAKSLADMADQTDKATKKFEVFFAVIYAPIKNAAMEWIAGVVERISKSVVAMGGMDSTLGKLAELINAFTGGGVEAAANAISGGDTTPLSRLTQEVERIEGNIVATRQAMRSLEESGQASSAQYADQVMQLGRLEGALKKAQDAQRKLITLPTTTVTADDPSKGRNPAIKTTGADKFAEAQRRITEETKAAKEAQDAYNAALAKGLPQGEAERQARQIGDMAKTISSMTKGLTDEQAKFLEPQIRALVQLQQGFDKTKEIAARATAINREYGDGTKELADTTWYLNEALAANAITIEQYNAALADANDRQALQAELSKRNADDITALGAGFTYAALQMQQSQGAFQLGQQAFTSSINLMSSAVSEFVEKGTLDFGKLAEAFAKMLAEMAAQMAIHAALKAVFKAAGTLFGGPTIDQEIADWSSYGSGGGGGGGFFSWLGSIFGGGRQHGGPVTPGVTYMVGERGPERFVPNVPGEITSDTTQRGGDTITVNVDMGQTQGARDPSSALEFGRRLKAAVKDVIMNEQRPGGTLYAR